MRNYTRRYGGFVSAAMLAAVTASGGGALAQAAESASFVFTASSNGAGGSALTSGEYDSAAKSLSEPRPSLNTDLGVVDTNRCVAYAMTQQFAAARAACDAAIKDAEQQRATLSVLGTERAARHDVALAYSNRAVLNWLSGNMAGAEQDLAKAKRLAPDADFVARNLSALHERKTVTAAAWPNTPAAPPH
jgi:hypothetical protein